MAFVQGDGVIRHEILQTLSGQQIENVIYSHQPGADPGPAVIAGINTQLIAWWTANIKPLSSVDLTLRGVRGTSLHSASSPVVETLVGSPTAGSVVQPSLPNNVALVVTNRTASRGRSFRGRTYFAGLPQTDEATPTAVSPATVVAILAAVAALLPALQAYDGSLTWGVFSQVAGHVVRAVGLYTAYNAHDANADFDSQRRRLAGRGN